MQHIVLSLLNFIPYIPDKVFQFIKVILSLSSVLYSICHYTQVHLIHKCTVYTQFQPLSQEPTFTSHGREHPTAGQVASVAYQCQGAFPEPTLGLGRWVLHPYHCRSPPLQLLASEEHWDQVSAPCACTVVTSPHAPSPSAGPHHSPL